MIIEIAIKQKPIENLSWGGDLIALWGWYYNQFRNLSFEMALQSLFFRSGQVSEFFTEIMSPPITVFNFLPLHC